MVAVGGSMRLTVQGCMYDRQHAVVRSGCGQQVQAAQVTECLAHSLQATHLFTRMHLRRLLKV
jgi:hypothetical protein